MRRRLAALCLACAPALPAQADCARLGAADSTTVLCEGIDGDGYVDLRPFLGVTVDGRVLGAGDAAVDLGFDPSVTVTPKGDIVGLKTGLLSLGALSLTNLGKIGGQSGAGVSTKLSGVITNIAGGDISSVTGHGVRAREDLTLTNTAGRIGNLGGGGAAVEAGRAASVTNSAGGTIESTFDKAIIAGSTLTLRNGPASTISSELDDAVSALGLLDARNDGVIESQMGAALTARGLATIENQASGVIRSRGEQPAIRLGLGDKLTNAGAITARQTAVAQDNGRLTLTNRSLGEIRSEDGRAVVMPEGAVINEAGAAIEGALGGVRVSAGRIENAGRIAAGSGPAITVAGRGVFGNALTIENSGVISGGVGIDVDPDAMSSVQVSNTGRIEGAGGVAIRIAPDRFGALVDLSGDSAILGDVLFAGADDMLRIGELTSGLLINSVFDGAGGHDLADFTSYAPGAVLDVSFLQPTTVALTVLAANGDALTGSFANFEAFRFAGVEVSFADLGRLAPAPVPLPGAAPLLLAGLTALAAASRRRTMRPNGPMATAAE